MRKTAAQIMNEYRDGYRLSPDWERMRADLAAAGWRVDVRGPHPVIIKGLIATDLDPNDGEHFADVYDAVLGMHQYLEL